MDRFERLTRSVKSRVVLGSVALLGASGIVALTPPPAGAPVVAMHTAPDAAHKAASTSLPDGPVNVEAFGSADDLGSPGTFADGTHPVAMVPTSSGEGYWLADSKGGVFTYGDAGFFGTASTIVMSKPVVAMAATPDNGGYWLVSSDGGVFSFGNAAFLGSTGGLGLRVPVSAIAVTPTGAGYWLVGADGGVFTFGDATFLGSAAGATFSPITGIARTPRGTGYWLVARDGGVFAFGDAVFAGAASGATPSPIVGIGATPSGEGYRLAARDGGVFSYGDADFLGSAAGTANHVVAIATTSPGDGYWLLTGPPAPEQRPRALVAPPAPPDPVGVGVKHVLYSNHQQRLWLYEADGTLFDSYLISGRIGTPSNGVYSVWTRMRYGRAGSLSLPYFVGFAHGRTTSIGFHEIPVRGNGSHIESESQLGQPLSHGCVRQAPADALQMWDWAPIGTVVVVVP